MLHRFAEFELDEERYELRGPAGSIELQPKVMQVLLHLVRNGERTLSREEVLDAVWPEVSVGEASLTRCISQARRALGESEADARIIRTVRGRGYCIGVPVEHGAAAVPAASAPPAPEPPAVPETPARAPAPQRHRLAAVAIGVALAALAWLARPFASLEALPPLPPQTVQPRLTVAVLPFEEVGVARRGDRLGESLALEVTDRLGDVTELSVLSPAASFRFGGFERDGREPAEVAAELGVGTLVLGRLRPAGEQLRVEVELVDAETGFRRWSESYERPPEEILLLQRQVARDVARVLGISVRSGAARARGQPHVEASRYLLEGRVAVLSARRGQLLEAVELYERAIEIDPERAPAYVALAVAYERLWAEDDPGVGWLARAEAVALRALELDPESAEAWATYGVVLRDRRHWERAERAIARSLELRPTADALVEQARLRCMRGRPGDALEPALRALELAPLSPAVHHTAGRVLHYLGRDERAMTHLRRALALAPRATYVPPTLASALEAEGRGDEATEVFLTTLPGWMRPLLRIHHRIAGSANGLRLLMALDAASSGRRCGRDALETAALRARIRDREEMLDCLAEAARHHLWYVRSEPVFDPYRDDPRFGRILREAGFGDA